jgi:hypothetical protein
MTASGPIDLTSEMSKRVTIHMNLGQEMVITTVDKLRLCLMENRDCLADKKEWVTPLGVFLVLVTTIVAADFHDFVLKAPVWSALYVLGSAASLVWLVRAGWKAWRNRDLGSIDTLIDRIKPESLSTRRPQQSIVYRSLATDVGAALAESGPTLAEMLDSINEPTKKRGQQPPPKDRV